MAEQNNELNEELQDEVQQEVQDDVQDDVQHVNKVIDSIGNVLIDLTEDTVEQNAVLSGITFHDRHGAPLVGTGSGEVTIVQTLGQSTTSVMSQKAVTDVVSAMNGGEVSSISDIKEKQDKFTIDNNDVNGNYNVVSIRTNADTSSKTIGDSVVADTEYDVVLYSPNQGLTEEEQYNARDNINAAATDGDYRNTGLISTLADNLLAPGKKDTPENDAENNPFVFRTSAGSQSIGDGYADIEKIRGRTYKWNQLVQNGNFESGSSKWYVRQGTPLFSNNECTMTAVEPLSNNQIAQGSSWGIAGHKYYVHAKFKGNTQSRFMMALYSGEWKYFIRAYVSSSYQSVSQIVNIDDSYTSSLYLGFDTSQSSMSIGDTMTFTDIQMVDLTAIYGAGNEPTTVEAFLKDYPMFNGYVDYTEGSMQGVKPTELATVGFNAYNPATGKAFLIGGNEYQITGAYTSISYSTGEVLTPDSYGGIIPEKSGVLTITGGNSTTTCVHLTWSGYRNGEYEPYWRNTISTHIVDYFANGMHGVGEVYDELTPTKAIKRFGIVDLGTLNWSKDTTTRPADGATIHAFYGRLSDMKEVSLSRVGNMYLPGYNATSVRNVDYGGYNVVEDKLVGGADNKPAVWIYNSEYNDYTTTEFKSAMSGVYLVYELAVYTETTIDPPLNLNYRVSDFGTEEMVYGTGDVAVPVPVEIEYQDNLKDKIRNINDLTVAELQEIIDILV